MITAPKKMATFYELRVTSIETVNFHEHINWAHDDLCISANGRLCGPRKAVALESRALAESFRSFLLPRMRKSKGESFDCDVVEVQQWHGTKAQEKRLIDMMAASKASVLRKLEGHSSTNVITL